MDELKIAVMKQKYYALQFTFCFSVLNFKYKWKLQIVPQNDIIEVIHFLGLCVYNRSAGVIYFEPTI